jgi:Flp pilus assembly protein TadG
MQMDKKKPIKRSRRGSILIMTMLALPVFIAPLVGLGIDATLCYIVQTELAAAVDGAALGAGRLLSTNANASDIANEFLNANFRVGQAGFWGSYNLTPTITVQNGTTKSVTVNATVTIPLIFMRLIRQNTAVVSATATATRRDARVELVIDRSGSMNTSDGAGSTVIADLVTYAQSFTQQFTNGYDEMGFVAFSGSGVVGYPTSPWPSPLAYNGAGGPDTSFNDLTTNDMVHQISRVTAGGGTGMGDALALAYVEIQKAHVRDLAATGKDTKLSTVVLFTDGVPSATSVYLNRNSNSVIAGGSGCTHQTDTVSPTNPMYAYVVITGSPPYTSQSVYTTGGMIKQLASLDPGATHTSVWYMSNPSGDDVLPSPTSPESGCASWNGTTNLNAIPSSDKYGYSLNPNGNGYKLSSIVNGGAASAYNGTAFSTTSPSNAYQWGLAGWSQVDNVAEAIRSDSNYVTRGDATPMAITIFTVGYTGNGGTDQGLLSKVANVKGCTFNTYSCYVNTEQSGLYVQASDKTQLANAFSTIATAILRLAH